MTQRLGVKDFYGRVWREYADPHHHPITAASLAVQREVVDRLILERRPGRILDLGCGPHPVIRPEQAPVVVRADIVPEMLLDLGKRERSRAVCLDARLLPFRRETFDLLWCGLLSDHVKDLAGWFEELVRVLRRGGTLGMACWERGRLPPERYPQGRQMAYTTAQGDELAVESLANWDEALDRLRRLDPHMQVHSYPVFPETYFLQVALSRNAHNDSLP